MRQQPLDLSAMAPDDHVVNDLSTERFGGHIFHLAKLRADASLKREAAQNTCAERVDRLDFQTTRSLNRAGEKLARAFQPRRINRPLGPKLHQVATQIVVAHHRPSAEAFEQAVLHLGGGGFGIGQTKNVLRLNTIKQKPRHTVRQHAGFSRTRVRRQPRGIARIRGIDLPLGGVVADHVRSSGTASLLVSHSPNRARWS